MKLAIAVVLLIGTTACGGPAVAPGAGPSERSSDPTTTASEPAATASPGPNEHRGWYLTARSRLDLDGDGVLDEVRVREPDRGDGIEVTVELADRVEVLRLRHTSSLAFTPYDHAEVDGTPGAELFVMQEVPRRTFRTLSWRDERFIEIEEPPGLRLTDDFAPDARARKWWIDGRELVTYVSVQRCAAGYDWVRCPATMPVEASRWRVVDGHWQSRSTGVWCVERDRPRQLNRC